MHEVWLSDDTEHPLRKRASDCTECGTSAVFFNQYNVTVQCHHCGAQEPRPTVREYQFSVWLSAMGFR